MKQFAEINIKTKDKSGRLLKGENTARVIAFFENMDRILGDGECFKLIKEDRTATIGVVKGGKAGLPFDLAVKRFDHKGLMHRLRSRVAGSRAGRLFKINLQFFKMALNVPEPVGFLEARDMRHAFYISRYIVGSANLAAMYKEGVHGEAGLPAPELAEALAEWHTAGAVHGDLKWSNILVQNNGTGKKFFFIDLDRARLFKKPSRKGIIKDLVRFYRYGFELGTVGWIDSEFFPLYMSFLPDEIRGKIELGEVRRRAERDFIRKGKVPTGRVEKTTA
jgi:tRNA A-37 threonylcarbamoyl transferase component Bud32